LNQDINLRGIVLTAGQYKEFDKRLVILTADRGRITVFANGARRQGSRLQAATQAFTMGTFTVREGRSAYSLVAAEIEKPFIELSYDLYDMCYASYMCEFISYYTREGISTKQELNLLYLGFMALLSNTVPKKFIKTIFEMRLMFLEGYGVHAFSCVKCSDETKKISYFDVQSGGAVCEDCKRFAKKPFQISEKAILTLRFIIGGDVRKIFSFQVPEDVMEEVISVSDQFTSAYVDKKFNSLNILSSLG